MEWIHLAIVVFSGRIVNTESLGSVKGRQVLQITSTTGNRSLTCVNDRQGVSELLGQTFCIAYSGTCHTWVLISPQPNEEGNKLQQQKILSFIYPIYNHNWRKISTLCVCVCVCMYI